MPLCDPIVYHIFTTTVIIQHNMKYKDVIINIYQNINCFMMKYLTTQHLSAV